MEKTKVERKYKDKLFRMVFREKDKLLSLYNAVNKSHYTNPDELEIVTLENAIYMNMKNDLAFLIDDCLNLYEHQSTVNPNMPLRDLIYVAKEYRRIIAEETLYSSEPIKLPTPKFIVFYNGTTKQPEKQVLKLSDLYTEVDDEVELELKVTVLNVNAGYNGEILEACQTLKEYSSYVNKVRTYVKEMELEKAVDCAIDECIKENVLKEFLIKYRAEAKAVCIFEYDEEREIELIKKAERRAARKQGLEEGRAKGLEEGRAEGRAAGHAEGRVEGRVKSWIELVYKKVQKGKSLDIIVDELEEEIEVIKPIYEVVNAMKDNFNCDDAYRQITQKTE